MFFHSMNFSIGKDNEVLRDTVYKFAQNEIAPIANQIDKENSFLVGYEKVKFFKLISL